MTEKVKWYYRPWVVILLIFLVLGPLGLPLVYKSPKFNRAWKVVLTFLTLLYTASIVLVTVEFVRELSRRIVQLQAVLG